MSDYEKTKLAGSDGTTIGNTGDAIHVSLSTNAPSSPIYTEFQSNHHDTFGRHKITNQYTIFEASFSDASASTAWDTSTTTGGTAAIDTNTSKMVLSTTTTTGSKAQLKSFRNIQYFRGKTNTLYLSALFGTPQTGVRKRVGLYDSSNGMFFEVDGTTLYAVVRSDASGSVVDTRVAQASWNGDKLDGTGDSGLFADPTKSQYFVFDLSHPTNLIRFGIVVDGEIIYVHTINYSNEVLLPVMRFATLPISAEVEATGSPASVDSLGIYSANIDSEGGSVQEGVLRVVDTDTTPVSVTTTEKVVAGIQLKSTSINASIKPLDFKLVGNSGTNNAYYKIIIGATLTGATWTDLTGTAQGLTNNPTYTGGKVISSGYFNLGGNDKSDIAASLKESNDYIGSLINGTSQNLIMVVKTVSGTGSILFSGSYKEFY